MNTGESYPRNYTKRGNYWFVDFCFPPGVRNRKSTRRTSKQAAAIEADRIIGEFIREADFHSGMKLFDWVERYKEIKTQEGIKTFKTQIPRLELLKKSLGNVFLKEINEKKLRDFLNEVSKGQKGKPLAAASINRWISLLNNLFKMAAEREETRLEKSPMRLIKKKQEKASDRRYNQAELTLLLNSSRILSKNADDKNTSNKYFFHLFKILMTTGARLGEILNARWEDLTENIKGGADLRIVNTKNNRTKIVRIIPEVFKDIKPLQGKSEYIIPFGSHQSCIVARPWKLVKKTAGISGRLHSVRHSYASIADREGMTDSEVMETMGWQDIRMIKTYVQPFRESVDDKIRKIGKKILK